MKKKQIIKNKYFAFTLIELSAVIVIIGILIAGVMTANGLVKRSKIAAAQSLTKASPINGIENNDLWLDSSQESSFKDNESSTGGAVTTWYDQKNASNKSLITVVGTGPTYSNTINYIHAVKFNGSNNDYLKLEDASFLNKNSYTIFVVEKRQSNSSNNYFLGDSAQTSTNQSLLLGYSADGSVIHSQSGSSLTDASTANVDSYANYNDKPRIFAFNFDTALGSKTYINGTLSGQSSANLAPLTNVTSLSIGKGYSGEIGEIAIFSRSLKSEERKVVEDYLAKKWSVKMTRESAPSCTEGVITENGCKKTCPVSVVGVSSPTTIADGESRTLTCGATGYAGGTTTQSYKCENGALNPSPGAVCTTAGATSSGATVCANGYAPSGEVCKQGCAFSNVNGIVNGTSVSVTSAATQIACNAPNYNTAKSVSYTCIGTSLSVSVNGCSDISANDNCSGNYAGTTCSTCKAGYTLASGCTACDTDNNYKMVNGVCAPPKPICSGGTVSEVGNYKIHQFTNVGTTTLTTTLSCSSGGEAQVLVVGGGGSGGNGSHEGPGGGGGGGGVAYAENYPIEAKSYSLTVGKGGDSVSYNYNGVGPGNNGGDSVFDKITAYGGGGGGSWGTGITEGKNGGSGGGSSKVISGGNGGTATRGTKSTLPNGINVTFYGNNGGNTAAQWQPFVGAGGGGAGGVGESTAILSTIGGKGGDGIANSITGTAIIYGSGGGGSGGTWIPSNGNFPSTGGQYSKAGDGGSNNLGGKGSVYNSSPGAVNPPAASGSSANGTAGNGGGGSNSPHQPEDPDPNKSPNSGAGSAGIVIVRYVK